MTAHVHTWVPVPFSSVLARCACGWTAWRGASAARRGGPWKAHKVPMVLPEEPTAAPFRGVVRTEDGGLPSLEDYDRGYPGGDGTEGLP